MAGLLAAQREAVLLHGLQHVAVADGGLHQVDALALHRQLEAEVGHHGGHRGVAAQGAGLLHGDGEDGDDLVAVHLVAVGVGGQAAVGVAVQGDAEVGLVLLHRGAQPVQVGGADAVVDVEAGGLGPQGVDDLGAGPGEGLGGDVGGRAVGAVDDDLDAVQAVGQHADQVGDVLVEALGVLADAADGGTGGTVPVLFAERVPAVVGLDRVLDPVVQLVAAAREELDAVVRHGVVAGGQHHAEVGAERAGEVGHGGGGQDADPEHVDAGARQTGDDGGLQELARGTRVTADHRDRPVAVEGAGLAEHVRRGDRQPERELRRQALVGHPAYAVRTEESSHCPVLHHHCSEPTDDPGRRTVAGEHVAPEYTGYSGATVSRIQGVHRQGGPHPRGAISACCTAAPCGPSSDRPSYARRRGRHGSGSRPSSARRGCCPRRPRSGHGPRRGAARRPGRTRRRR